ncbi:MAG: MCE family protein [Bacteroidetes bacterium]|nr:MCE family protein [Bacteroidota bacterium]
MKEQQRNEIKVGLTVVVGLAILLVGFSTFKDWSVGADEYTIRMRFPVSAGIDVGDQVTVNGVRAGKVDAVDLLNGGVEVHALISSDIVIKENARPIIQMLELMGGKKIDIIQGNDGAALPEDGLLMGRVDPDIAGALGLLGDVQENVRNIGSQADTLLRSINAIVGDRAFVSSLKETVANLHAVSGDLRAYMVRNNRNIDVITVNMVSLTERVDTMLAELQPAVSGALHKSDRVLGNADSLIAEVRGIVGEIRGSRGLLNTVLHDTTFVHRMDTMLRKLDTLSSIIINGEFITNIDLF